MRSLFPVRIRFFTIPIQWQANDSNRSLYLHSVIVKSKPYDTVPCAQAGLCLIVFLFKGRLEQRIFIGLLDYIMIAAMDAIILFCASTVLGVSLDELVWKKGMYTVLVTA